MYSRQVVEYFRKRDHIGELDNTAPDVGMGMKMSPCCGAVIFFVQADSNECIVDIKYKATGFPDVLAIAAFLAEKTIGRTLLEALQVDDRTIIVALELKSRSVRKVITVLSTFKQAIATCQAKRRSINDQFN